MKFTMRCFLALLSLWWLEVSLAFVAGIKETLALRGNRTTATTAETTTSLAGINGILPLSGDAHSKLKTWDTSATTEKTSIASFASTFFSNQQEEQDDNKNEHGGIHSNTNNGDGIGAKNESLVDWNTNNLLAFLEKLAASPLKPEVIEQTRDFVSRIETLYDAQNPYHNFEHATHVGKSITQLLGRPGVALEDGFNPMEAIRSDPLLSFSLVFSALIHDAEHAGVSNAQLIQEESPLAERYANQSIAERNSLDLAFGLLEDPALADLRNAIYADGRGQRFEENVRRAVLATDIADSERRTERQQRWDAVYGNKDSAASLLANGELDRARTVIAMEHLMQVADVGHTMQSGPVNHEWNERLFAELRQAYKHGRSEKDPLDGWYPSELGFFDFYVIPLARKWERCCGVNGNNNNATAVGEAEAEELFPSNVSFVEQAERNRQEWVEIGHGIVKEFEKNY